MTDKSEIKKILLGNNSVKKRGLFRFNKKDETRRIYKKFQLFTTTYERYIKHKSADFHEKMVSGYINSYVGKRNFLNIAFRGSAKTSLLKLFVVFVLLNDEVNSRKFIKILTKDLKNSKQLVTDIYNLIIEVESTYGDVFFVETKKKHEETMGSFTMKNGIKVTAGTVGQTARGSLQDAYRPDWIWFDDVEDRLSADSDTITSGIIRNIDEAIQGLSVDGNYVCTANYITDIGVIENMRNKNVDEMLTPIVDEKGIPTWDYFSKEKVEAIRLDAEDWFGEYMNDPVSAQNREFKQEYFTPIKMAEVLAKKTKLFLTIDSAVKKDEGSDFSGFTLNWVCTQNKWHIKSWREKINSGELVNRMFELWNYWSPQGLESIGLEETTATLSVMPFLEDEMRKRNVYMTMVMLKHGGVKKETRIRGLLPRYTSRSIYHIENECKDLEAEELRFPNGQNDDVLDSLAYTTQVASPPEQEEMFYNEDENCYNRFAVKL